MGHMAHPYAVRSAVMVSHGKRYTILSLGYAIGVKANLHTCHKEAYHTVGMNCG